MYKQLETYLNNIAETHLRDYYDNTVPYYYRDTVIVGRDSNTDYERPCGQSVSPYSYTFTFDNPDNRDDTLFEDAFMNFVEVFDNLNIANNEINITDRNGTVRQMFITYLSHDKFEENTLVRFKMKITFDILRVRS